MTGNIDCRLRRIRLRPAILAIAFSFWWIIPVAGQYPTARTPGGQSSALTGSVSVVQQLTKLSSTGGSPWSRF